MFSELFVASISLSEKLPKDSYLNELPVIRSLQAMERLTFTNRVTFLVGENGIGKSTLIEAIAVHQGFNPEGGTVNFRFSTEDSHSPLHEYLRVEKGMGIGRMAFFCGRKAFTMLPAILTRWTGFPDRGLR